MFEKVRRFLNLHLSSSLGCLLVAVLLLAPLLYLRLHQDRREMVELQLMQVQRQVQVRVINRGEPVIVKRLSLKIGETEKSIVQTQSHVAILPTGQTQIRIFKLPKPHETERGAITPLSSERQLALLTMDYSIKGREHSMISSQLMFDPSAFSSATAATPYSQAPTSPALNSGITLDPLVLNGVGRYRIKNLRGFKYRLLLPPEITSRGVELDGRDLIFTLSSAETEPREFTFYLEVRTASPDANFVQLLNARAYVGPGLAVYFLPLRYDRTLLLAAMLLLLAPLLGARDQPLPARACQTAGRVLFAMGGLAFASDLAGTYLATAQTSALALFFARTFLMLEHNDIHLFLRYLLQPLFWYVLLLHPLALYFGRYQAQASRRTFAVKAFFFPMVSTWTLNNIWNLHLTGQSPAAFTLQTFVSIMMLIDVLVFMLGYFVEHPILKNEIKSSEPTLFGWLICIFCYPPFVYYTYHWFQVPLNVWHWNPGILLHRAFTFLDAVCWTCFVLASIALGWRGSNLTSRGIVSHGPYAVVRHPAYVSKLLAWTVGGLILGNMLFFHVLSLWAVYTMRALTEERHLRATDPEYAEYCKRVRWRMIPGIF